MTTNEHQAPAVLVYGHEDRLGDALLKLPAMAALRSAFPDHHITWMAGCGPSIFGSQLAPLADGLVDCVEQATRLGCSWKEHWRRPLPGRFYDVIIDTTTVLRATLLLRRIPHNLFISPAIRFLLSDRRPGPEGYGGSLRKRLLKLIQLAADRPVRDDYRPRPPDEYRALASKLLPPGPVYVGIAPGAGGRDKCWPLERFIRLGRDQQHRGRTPVYLIGPDEMEWLPRIRRQVPGALFPEAETQATQRRGPLLCLALAECLALGVANDSGTGHLIAASGTPLVSLFGRTSVEKFVEDNVERTLLRAGDFGGETVDAVPFTTVAEAVEEALERTGRV